MMTQPSHDTITRLLVAAQEGDRLAINELFPLIYEQLHALAQRQRRGWHGDYTVNTTALVHEAYLKLTDQVNLDWESRAHFFGVADRATPLLCPSPGRSMSKTSAACCATSAASTTAS